MACASMASAATSRAAHLTGVAAVAGLVTLAVAGLVTLAAAVLTYCIVPTRSNDCAIAHPGS
jgi:hypothetical protein